MLFAKLTGVAAAALLAVSCGGPEPAGEPAREPSAAESAAAEVQRMRDEDSARLEKRAADLEKRWTEMEGKIKGQSGSPTAGLRAEVQEDIQSVRGAVADLKTTTPENWWERHERAIERSAADIEDDVRRFAKAAKPGAAQAEPTASTGPFESRRDQFVSRMRARAEAMEEQLKGVRARAAVETEL